MGGRVVMGRLGGWHAGLQQRGGTRHVATLDSEQFGR